jgi:predicted ribosome quality control (RQC) complex YloA/Tae2 family protein
VLRKAFPSLGATLVTEILARSSCTPEGIGSRLDPETMRRIETSFLSVLRDLASPRPCVYCDSNGLPLLFSLIPLQQTASLHVRAFSDCHEAIRFFVSRQRAGERYRQLFDELHAPLARALEKMLRTRNTMEEEARDAGRAEQYERWGALILQHLGSLAKGDRTLEAAGESIPLQPQLTPAQNAQHYFKKAKQSRSAAEEKTIRMAALARDISAGHALRAALEQASSPAELEEFRTVHAETLQRFGLTKEAQARAALPFRIFRVDGGFEVWAGKNSNTNDLLTLRHARPDDLWFHARGSSGSHVLLKVASASGEPSKRAREQAAAIAAYFSRMKTASLVPVAMTERRHVRKPRGAPAGTVALEREKVLFVEPALPPEHDH